MYALTAVTVVQYWQRVEQNDLLVQRFSVITVIVRATHILQAYTVSDS